MEKLLKGKIVADKINEEILSRLPALYEKGIVPTLAIVRVGENPGDIAYENGAVKKAKSLGLQTEKFICPADMEGVPKGFRRQRGNVPLSAERAQKIDAVRDFLMHDIVLSADI